MQITRNTNCYDEKISRRSKRPYVALSIHQCLRYWLTILILLRWCHSHSSPYICACIVRSRAPVRCFFELFCPLPSSLHVKVITLCLSQMYETFPSLGVILSFPSRLSSLCLINLFTDKCPTVPTTHANPTYQLIYHIPRLAISSAHIA